MALPVKIERRQSATGVRQSTPDDLRRALVRYIPRLVKNIMMDTRSKGVVHLTIQGNPKLVEVVMGDVPQKYRAIKIVDEGRGQYTVSLLKTGP